LIRSINGRTPRIAESVFVSETAYIVGDVEIGEHSGVWPGAVIRADFGAIKIGSYVSVEDNCCLHAEAPMEIGDDVTIGHGAVLHGRKVGSKVLIGMNATLLDSSEVGDFCIIGAGSVVTEGMIIPSGSFVVGVPAKIKGQLSEERLQRWKKGHIEVMRILAEQYREQGL